MPPLQKPQEALAAFVQQGRATAVLGGPVTAVDHRHVVGAKVRDIDPASIRGHRHASGRASDSDRGADHRVRCARRVGCRLPSRRGSRCTRPTALVSSKLTDVRHSTSRCGHHRCCCRFSNRLFEIDLRFLVL